MKPHFAFFYSLLIALTASASQAMRPHIILVMADDQGYGDAGYTGHPFVKTPHLDAMAKQSVVFNRFYAAAPVCSPTRASVMTGRHPMRVNVPNHGHYMRPQETTLAEALQSAGYLTGHFGKWHIGSVQPTSPTSPGKVGFDYWLTGLNFFDQSPYLASPQGYLHTKGQGSVLTMDATIDFLKSHKDGDKPLFAVTWFPAPHSPHKEFPVDFPDAESLYKDAGKHRGYFLEITLLDQQIGRLRRSLRELDMADNTLIWYCSDNGGLIHESAGGREKKGSIYEGGLRVPALIEWPKQLKPSQINTPCTTSDIYPTLLNIAGVSMPDQAPLDGMDLTGLLKTGNHQRPAIGFWHNYCGGQVTHSNQIIRALMVADKAGKPSPYPERLRKNIDTYPKLVPGNYQGHAAWLDWPFKLHRIQKDKLVTFELYNLVEDPQEANNIIATHTELAQKMKSQLATWQASVFASWMGADYP